MMKFCEFDQENQENWKLLTRKNQENAKYGQENQENIIIFGYHTLPWITNSDFESTIENLNKNVHARSQTSKIFITRLTNSLFS